MTRMRADDHPAVNVVDRRPEADEIGGAEDGGGMDARSPVEPAVVQGRDPGWEELLELADRVGPSAELAGVDDRALTRLVSAGAARIAAETCRWLDLVAELVVRRIWVEEGARTPAAWLSWAVGMSPSAARDHVRVALRLRELSRVRAEFAAGRISYSKVRAISRVAVPETEAQLLEWSRMATGADLERIVAGFRTAQRAALPSPGPIELARHVRLRDRGDGTSEVIVRLPDDEAQALYAGAQRLIDLEDAELRGISDREELERQTQPDPGDPDPGDADPGDGCADGGDASEGDGRLGDSAESPPVAATQLSDRPRAARLADAILQAVQAAVAAGGADTTGADRDTLVVHVESDELASEAEVPTSGVPETDPPDVEGERGRVGTAHIGRGPASKRRVAAETRYGTLPALSRRTLRRMACEAGLVLVTTDRDGTPIDVGRRQRRLTTALRRALLDRDRSCRFPGCGSRRHLHGHHIWHWGDGGPTDLGNLVLLCSYHHRYVHDHDLGVRLRPGAAHEFRFPDGRRIARVRSLTGVPGAGGADGASGAGAAQPAPALTGEDDGASLRPVHWDGRYCLDTTVAVLQQQVHAVLPHAAGVLAA